MSEIKVIREDEFGVLVEQEAPKCKQCKLNNDDITVCLSISCTGGRYLTEEEEKEYYSAKNV